MTAPPDPAGRPRQTPILMYHSVSTRAGESFRRFVVDPRLFADHMCHLVEAGYQTRTVTAVTGGPRAERPVVLTFDDGFADFHSDVLPVLDAHGLTATLYVTTGYIGGTSAWMAGEGEGDRRMLSWTQLAEIAASGVEIGAHSITHPELDLLPPRRARDEVTAPRKTLEDRLQVPVRSFAYPFGYYDARVRAAVAQAGYLSACAVDELTVAGTDDVLLLPRLTVAGGTTLAGLERLLERRSGVSDWGVARAKRRVWQTWRRATRSGRQPAGAVRGHHAGAGTRPREAAGEGVDAC
ncbi:MAG: polysaccharide deacetylase family protein [Streptosporangiaceae bacterium]